MALAARREINKIRYGGGVEDHLVRRGGFSDEVGSWRRGPQSQQVSGEGGCWTGGCESYQARELSGTGGCRA